MTNKSASTGAKPTGVWGEDANNLSAKDATDHKQLERAEAAVSATGWSPEPGPTVWRLNKKKSTERTETKLGKWGAGWSWGEMFPNNNK